MLTYTLVTVGDSDGRSVCVESLLASERAACTLSRLDGCRNRDAARSRNPRSELAVSWKYFLVIIQVILADVAIVKYTCQDA